MKKGPSARGKRPFFTKRFPATTYFPTTRAVSSALRLLTTEFGMGSGRTTSLQSPEKRRKGQQNEEKRREAKRSRKKKAK